MSASLDLTRRWVHTLSTEIGIRLSGTENDRRAADFVESEFREVFPEVIRHEYRFLGWRPVREGQLAIGRESGVATRLGVACPSTPEGGVRGRLRRFGGSQTYGLWEEGGGGASAHIRANTGPGGQAIPLLWQPFGSMPAGIVGSEMAERLARAESDDEVVTFCCQTEYAPNAVSWNVEGIAPGDPDRWIIVTGHYDTQYVSPGANDNTASTACLAAIGKLLLHSPRRNRPTLRFLATGGEEIDLQGARSYVRDLCCRGDARKVVLALNFDSLTWGDMLLVGHSDNAAGSARDLQEMYSSQRLSSYSGESEIAPLGLGGGVDSAPFHHAGLPTLNINTRGDAETVALWHTPEDTEDRVPWPRIDDAIALFSEFLDKF